MRRYSFCSFKCALVLCNTVISFTACSRILKINKANPISGTSIGGSGDAVGLIQSPSLQHIAAQFIMNNYGIIIALLALFALLLITRAFNSHIVHRQVNFSGEELSMIKIIQDTAGRIWENHRPEKKVVRIRDYQGVEE